MLGLGIDTGGTYTDSVISDLDTGAVLARSKALTTRDDLVKGIVASLKGLGPLNDISLVSLSSTLATNSVVEGKSCRVGLISIGKRFRGTVNVSEYSFVEGEYDLRGNIVKELDLQAAEGILDSMRGKVDVIAVAGYLSVRFPAHEDAVRSAAQRILGLPVVCAHELTSKLGFEERINTAVINAGLVPIIIELIGAVRTSLSELGVRAPLMIVKGDGSVMNAETAVRRPIETIMSGPASSLTSAMATSGKGDAIIADMGGTTTDIGVIKGGFIHTIDSGAVIGGHRTRVRAADVSTYGIGGDSRICASNGNIMLSPVRVIPVCTACSVWPEIGKGIDEGADDFCILASNRTYDRLSEADRSFLDKLSDGPASVSCICGETGVKKEEISLMMLESEGYITCIGVTPTDVLAADGKYKTDFSYYSAKAVQKLADDAGIDFDEFIAAAKSAVIGKIVGSICDHIDRVNSEGEMPVCGTEMPLIGIGAPAGAWLPEAASELGMDLILPNNYDVGNAIGAVSSSVTEYVEVYVRASPKDFSEDPECRVYTGEDSYLFKGKEDAVSFALKEGLRLAEERARSSGSSDVVTDYKIERICIDMLGNGHRTFRGADVTVRASGRPRLDDF